MYLNTWRFDIVQAYAISMIKIKKSIFNLLKTKRSSQINACKLLKNIYHQVQDSQL